MKVDLGNFDMVNMTAIQESSGNGNPMYISWSDYHNVDSVYLMARKQNSTLPTFTFQMRFTSEKNEPMSITGQFFLGMFLTLLGLYGVIFGLYKLHHKEIIEVPIPKFCRVWYLKGYLSRAEKKELNM